MIKEKLIEELHRLKSTYYHLKNGFICGGYYSQMDDRVRIYVNIDEEAKELVYEYYANKIKELEKQI